MHAARLERWLDGPQRWAANPAFRRWAERFPLTRWIARRRARQLFDLVAGFVYSQVLLACIQLKLFERLAEGPQTVDTLAAALQLPGERLRRLLDAAVALRLLARRSGDRVALGPLGAATVRNGAVTALVEHHTALYDDLRDPLALLRGAAGTTALGAMWPYAGSGTPAELPAAAVAGYSALMAASQPLVADAVLDAWPPGRHRCLLDVGGGEGGFLAAVAQRHPDLRLMLFDLPAVAARARERLAPLGARVRCVGGDFLREPLPQGADLISLVRVVHDHDDAAVATLLRAAFAALPPGGTLMLAEPLARTPGAAAMGDAYFGCYLLAMGSGRPRSADVLGAMLAAAGFERVRQVPTHLPLQTGLLLARRPV